LLLGLTLNTLLPKAASIAHRISDIYSKVCILIIFLLFIVPALQALMKFSLVEFAAIIIVMSLALAAGYFLGGPVSKDRISIAMAATECNLTALLVIAHVSYPKVHILGPLLAYIIISFLTATAWNKFMLYRMKERGETLD
jgi:predicted Na+-dependent transporter